VVAVNGEAIYGTRPSPFYFPDITWRATVKPGKDLPAYPQLARTEAAFSRLGERGEARLLPPRITPRCRFQREGNVLQLRTARETSGPLQSVLVLEIADQEPRVAKGFRADQLPRRLDPVACGRAPEGRGSSLEWKTRSATNFKQFAQESNVLLWYPYKSLDGNYEVESPMLVRTAGRQQVQPRGGAAADSGAQFGGGVIEGTQGKFVTRNSAASWKFGLRRRQSPSRCQTTNPRR